MSEYLGSRATHRLLHRFEVQLCHGPLEQGVTIRLPHHARTAPTLGLAPLAPQAVLVVLLMHLDRHDTAPEESEPFEQLTPRHADVPAREQVREEVASEGIDRERLEELLFVL